MYLEKYLINRFLKSDKFKNYLIKIWSKIMAIILQFHLSLIICYLTTLDSKANYYFVNIFNFICPICISVSISLISNKILFYVESHNHLNMYIVNYFIDNFNKKNLILWKRICVFVMCVYVCLLILFTEINNYIILINTLQNVCSFIINDSIENKIFHAWMDRPRIIRYKNPKVVITKNLFEDNDYFFIEDDNIEKDYDLCSHDI